MADTNPLHKLSAAHITIFLVWLLFIGAVVNEDVKAEWRLMTNPMVFTKNVRLRCVATPPCCESYSKVWKGGRDNKQLTFNEKPGDKSKYNVMIQSTYTDLIIKDFGEEDIDKEYTCIYGFYSHTDTLSHSDNNYEVYPTNDSMYVSYNVSRSHVVASVQFMKVFPIPVCEVVSGNITLDSTSKNSMTKTGIYYDGGILLEYQLTDINCYPHLNIVCVVGSFSIDVVNVNLSDRHCSGSQDDHVQDGRVHGNNVLIIVLPVLFGALIIISVVIGIIYSKRKQRKEKGERNSYAKVDTRNTDIEGNVKMDTTETV